MRSEPITVWWGRVPKRRVATWGELTRWGRRKILVRRLCALVGLWAFLSLSLLYLFNPTCHVSEALRKIATRIKGIEEYSEGRQRKISTRFCALGGLMVYIRKCLIIVPWDVTKGSVTYSDDGGILWRHGRLFFGRLDAQVLHVAATEDNLLVDGI